MHVKVPIGRDVFFEYYIIFNSICQISQYMTSTRSAEDGRASVEGQGELICYDAGGKKDSRETRAYADRILPIGGPPVYVSGFKVNKAIWLHSRENFAYVGPIGKFGPDRPRPARSNPLYYYTTARTICQ